MPGGAGQPRKQLDAWQDWAKQRGARGPGLRAGRRGRRARRPGRQEPLRRRAGRPGRARRRRSRATASSSPPARVKSQPRAARRRPARDRPPRRADRRGRVDASSGSSTRRCSSRPTRRPPPATSRSAAAPGPRCTTRSPRPSRSTSTPSTPTPATALAYAYDIVCNGNEIGGGSIRIHRGDVQKRVFAVMGLDRGGGAGEVRLPARRLHSSARRRTAASPSAGTGSCALLAGTDSIRDVIAFPKTGGGYDPLTAAPAPITPEQRKEAGVDATAARRTVPPGELISRRFAGPFPATAGTTRRNGIVTRR